MRRSSFGTVATLLETVPLLSTFFVFTNTGELEARIGASTLLICHSWGCAVGSRYRGNAFAYGAKHSPRSARSSKESRVMVHQVCARPPSPRLPDRDRAGRNGSCCCGTSTLCIKGTSGRHRQGSPCRKLRVYPGAGFLPRRFYILSIPCASSWISSVSVLPDYCS